MNFELRTVNLNRLPVKFIPYTLYCSNTINAKFLPDLPDMYIYGTVTYNNIISPYLVENFIPEKHTAWF